MVETHLGSGKHGSGDGSSYGDGDGYGYGHGSGKGCGYGFIDSSGGFWGAIGHGRGFVVGSCNSLGHGTGHNGEVDTEDGRGWGSGFASGSGSLRL